MALRLVKDKDHKVVDAVLLDAHPVWERSQGLEAQEMVGGRFTEAVTSADQGFLDACGEAGMSGDHIAKGCYIRESDQYLESSVFRLGPRTVGVLAKDITERRRAEEALRKSKPRFRSIFEVAAMSSS